MYLEQFCRRSLFSFIISTPSSGDEVKVDYDIHNPFSICAASHKPIYRGSPMVSQSSSSSSPFWKRQLENRAAPYYFRTLRRLAPLIRRPTSSLTSPSARTAVPRTSHHSTTTFARSAKLARLAALRRACPLYGSPSRVCVDPHPAESCLYATWALFDESEDNSHFLPEGGCCFLSITVLDLG